MPLVLNLVYAAVLLLAAPWLIYSAVTKRKYRQGLAAKLLGHVPRCSGDRPRLWVHAVSVGEVNLLPTLLEQFEKRYPAWEYVISTTTRTGYELARQKFADKCVFYCPLDFSWAVRRAMSRVRPQLLMLTELELWPNMIRAARKRGAPVVVINGRLSEQSARGYGRIKPLVRRMLCSLDLILAQTPDYAARFLALGAEEKSVHVTGSLKFDGAQTERGNARTTRLARLAGIGVDDVVWLSGSTQREEEEISIAAFRQLSADYPALRLILVPRHPERFREVAQMLERSGLVWQRRSGLDAEGPNPAARVLLVDRVGELGAWWGTAHVALVGGSMGSRGGQNMIEPAAYGAAVSFGPNTRNFRDVVQLLLQNEAAVVVKDEQQVVQFLRRCLLQPEWAHELGGKARQLVLSQLGATKRSLDLLEPLIQAAPLGGDERARAA